MNTCHHIQLKPLISKFTNSTCNIYSKFLPLIVKIILQFLHFPIKFCIYILLLQLGDDLSSSYTLYPRFSMLNFFFSYQSTLTKHMFSLPTNLSFVTSHCSTVRKNIETHNKFYIQKHKGVLDLWQSLET